MRSVSAGYLRSTARAAVVLAATILAACAVNSPPPPDGGGESSDSTEVDYDRMFLEIHSGLTAELLELERSGKGGARLAEIQSIVMAAEEFYLEGKPLIAIKLLTEAELLLRQ
jgi:hypothetical protein